MDLTLASEYAQYQRLLTDHAGATLRGLRKLKPEHWDWTPNQAAPSSRTIAAHMWQWMACDRQHIEHSDFSQHTLIPEPPSDPVEFCRCLEQEIEFWMQLLGNLSVDDLDSLRLQFGDPECEMNVRSLIGHMIQNVIYKHGQFSELFYALGYDGNAPYSAPFPNDLYAKSWDAQKSIE